MGSREGGRESWGEGLLQEPGKKFSEHSSLDVSVKDRTELSPREPISWRVNPAGAKRVFGKELLQGGKIFASAQVKARFGTDQDATIEKRYGY